MHNDIKLNPVVTIQEIQSGIALITMQDRVSKNSFSPELIDGLIASFEHVQDNEKYKAVVLTGYDSYFASGGTQETLLSLHDGEGQFTDAPLYDLPLRCEIPVISAMQGHGIGGGFAMGLFADFVVLSRESLYTTNFMKYGFTPGFGSTYVLKEKLGRCLAQDMLMTANSFRGEELKNRGVSFPVMPRADVLEHAISIASGLAEKPRVSLITLKNHLVEDLRNRLPEVTGKEVAMHQITFHLPEVREKIETLFKR